VSTDLSCQWPRSPAETARASPTRSRSSWPGIPGRSRRWGSDAATSWRSWRSKSAPRSAIPSWRPCGPIPLTAFPARPGCMTTGRASRNTSRCVHGTAATWLAAASCAARCGPVPTGSASAPALAAVRRPASGPGRACAPRWASITCLGSPYQVSRWLASQLWVGFRRASRLPVTRGQVGLDRASSHQASPIRPGSRQPRLRCRGNRGVRVSPAGSGGMPPLRAAGG
jgi:hypothetical protein